MKFNNFDIDQETVNILQKMNITKPTPVQKKTIPLLLKDKNVMVQSKTGTGKTLTFLIPIIEQLEGKNNECLIIAPTRELAKQINRVIKNWKHNVSSMTIYGGVSYNRQIQKLQRGTNIICATPGRLIDLYKQNKVDFSELKFLVLDEADRLWDMGFAPDIKYILNAVDKHAKNDYQFMLFSATLQPDIQKLVKEFTKNEFETVDISKDDLTVQNTRQYYYLINRFKDKFDVFMKVLREERPERALVFVNTKRTGKWLFRQLKRNKMDYWIGYISGDLSQHQREKILKDFRDEKVDIMIATDVAARGLDIQDISHVINYDVPKFPENYVHRIGRTSRMNKEGVAITLCLKNEYEYLCHIEGLIDKEIKRKMLESQRRSRYDFPIKTM